MRTHASRRPAVIRKRWFIILTLFFTVLHLILVSWTSDVANSQWTEEGQRDPNRLKFEVASAVNGVLLYPFLLAPGYLYFPLVFSLNSLIWGAALAWLTLFLLRARRPSPA